MKRQRSPLKTIFLALFPVLLLAALTAVAGRGAAQCEASRDTAASAALPDADTIIARAIARRHEVLAQFQHASYEAYVKFVARDLSKPRDSAQSIIFIRETRSSAYWAHNRRYKETVLAHRQPRRFAAPRSAVAVDEILNIDRSTINLVPYAGGVSVGASRRLGFGRNHAPASRFAVLSPLAESAPAYYSYKLLEVVDKDGQRLFRLAVIPRSSAIPLFKGTIEVADPTWDFVAMDVGVNEAVQFSSVRNLRLEERFKDVGKGRWMPYEIRLTGESRPRIKVPVLGLSGQVSFEQIASFDGFRFDDGKPPTGLNEYRVVVQEGADHPESSAWTEPPAIPLTDEEQAAWARADSAARNTPFIRKVGESVGAAARLATDPGFFHYNRVDGFYIGAAHDWYATPDVAFTTKLGYALGSRDWQYRLGSRVCLSDPARLWVGAWYHDETVARPTLVSSHYDPTFRALFAHADPLDYYRERGLGLSLEMKIFDLTRLSLVYNDARQSSLETLTSYPFDWTRHPPSGNPAIRDGHLRSVSASLSYDSRQFLRTGGQDLRLSPPSWTAGSIGLEIAAPSVIPNDFSYRRYTLALGRAQTTPGLGTTTVSLAAGIATGPVPPQRFFTVDFGMEFLAVEGRGFTTLDRTNFYGNRALMLMVRHDFGRLLFARSGLPLVRNLPFNLGLHGGVFWTDFSNHALIPAGTTLASAPKPYAEAGIALGNLTPFLSPFNLSVHFAWQLSSYPTRRFRFGIGITGP